MIQGSPSELYSLLPKYFHVLKKENEGTVTYLKSDGNNNFLYYFVAIGSCINGFLQYLWVISRNNICGNMLGCK